MRVRMIMGDFVFVQCVVFIANYLMITGSTHQDARQQGIASDENNSDYCLSRTESFQPRCLKNEVVIMKSAVYGRMRISRCLKAEEVAAFGDDPRYFRCSADVLPILDRKCSGKTECDIRLMDFSSENVDPCFPGLNVFLTASYDCYNVADEQRSCSLTVTSHPIHIIASSSKNRVCGTKSQPWIIEAPSGQTIRISLLDFSVSKFATNPRQKPPCIDYGSIIEKAAKRNTAICGGMGRRNAHLYTTTENSVELVFDDREKSDSKDDVKQFALRVEAVGCSDLIPPENAWLKRIDDKIVIGCYSSRRTWHLRCEEETWIGVFGNCSQADHPVMESDYQAETENSHNYQVFLMVAIGGFALTICLVFLLVTIIWLRRFSAKKEKTKDYKTLSFVQGTNIPHCNQFGMDSSVGSNDPRRFIDQKQMPTYSVYLGEGNFNDTNRPALVSNSAHSLARE